MILTVTVYLAFAVLLVAAAAIDVGTLRIPNVLIAALVALWVVWRVALGVGGTLVGTDFITSAVAPAPFKGVSLANGIMGAVALGGGMLVATAMYEAITKRRAMGGGDIKLLLAIGLFLGLERSVLCLLVACAVSVLTAVLLPRVRWGDKSMVSEAGKPVVLRSVPFGPALAIGSAAALFAL